MPNAKDVNINTEWLKVFSVGDSGSGKSAFASTFPTPGFVFDFGGEIISYRGKDFDYEQFEVSAKGWSDFEKVFLEIKKTIKEGKYQSVIIDNVTAMTDVCMEKALQLDIKRSLTGGPVWNIHYGLVKNLMEGRLRQVLNLECNLDIIAHLDIITDKETGAFITVQPSMTGSLSVDIPSYFQEVYYHTTRKEGGETVWVMQTIPIGHNHGRSRASGRERLLPDLVPNDYEEIMAYLTGKKKKAKK
jgi:hypothetical protein